ncbi:hypothetical protein KY084_14870 [Stakelama sp. CBK3Z-3]|uniref:ACT domain-containing protein n=1 Tax=Stakelama flava TaxID=2860338 RepID=A0ABS6XPK5_9SPHN|nr:hypothetical protein [Stakelama flava]MBW4332147.1 hypothetical protein [Stakelama flava]
MTSAAAFLVEAESGAALLCRLVGLLAQRDLQIHELEARPRRAGTSEIRIVLTGLAAHEAQIVAAKMERMIGVSAVRLDPAAAVAA